MRVGHAEAISKSKIYTVEKETGRGRRRDNRRGQWMIDVDKEKDVKRKTVSGGEQSGSHEEAQEVLLP